jgi:DUF1009 family protein
MKKVGLIAGNGRLPILFARTAKEEGVTVVAVAHEGESLREIEAEVEDLTWIKVGQLERIIATFKDRGIEQAVMAGGIHKSALLGNFDPDARALAMLGRLGAWGDDAILRGVAGEIEAEGIRIVESTLFLGRILTPLGPIAGGDPDDAQWKDIRLGVAVAKALGQWDVGQSVVVKSGMVLAVEAIEGTDATIDRIPARDAVVVKVSKPTQDMRFDVPAVGPETVDRCAAKGVAVLALEAGKTLLLDKDEILERARATGLRIVGVDPAA